MLARIRHLGSRRRLAAVASACAVALALALLASPGNAAEQGARSPAAATSPAAAGAADVVDVFRKTFAPGVDRILAYRIYTGPDGHAKLEKVYFVGKRQPFFDKEKGLFSVEGVQVNKESVAFLQGRLAHVNIYNAPGDVDLPAHTSPGSELFLILRGTSTMYLHDGTRHTFGPGDIVIFEDTTGSGHSGRTGPEGFTAVNLSFVVQEPIGADVSR